MKPGEHGPDKLYDKFRVFRTKTGEELTGRGEFMFVLRPETNDRAAWEALRLYARLVERSYPQLSEQIVAELTRIHHEVGEALIDNPKMTVDEVYRKRSDDRPPPPMTIARTRACVYCGANQGSFCLKKLEGEECWLEKGNG
jgi:hypothetical protein